MLFQKPFQMSIALFFKPKMRRQEKNKQTNKMQTNKQTKKLQAQANKTKSNQTKTKKLLQFWQVSPDKFSRAV